MLQWNFVVYLITRFSLANLQKVICYHLIENFFNECFGHFAISVYVSTLFDVSKHFFFKSLSSQRTTLVVLGIELLLVTGA